jgi:hypothetical protein
MYFILVNIMEESWKLDDLGLVPGDDAASVITSRIKA